jgi:pimeloyl-ACP methyl ester carboxylesterase
LLGLLSQLSVDRVTVVATSLGGAVAQHLTLLAPERVERLVLLASVDASAMPTVNIRRLTWMMSGLALVVRVPVVGERVRLMVARPQDGFAADWTPATALQATTYGSLP